MKKQFDLRNHINSQRAKFVRDIRDYNSVLDVMQNIDMYFMLCT